ncbi:hypothetical protein CWI75_14365 [Kineobactrum sediminis]|uniref:Glycosyltransferase 2-like domain-containing protein n=1 Tax=Kineobactrum sediminis TaxID=1905677 RepID=A0A2N5XZX6_9GAMM|nr:glycosyltransferase [Kineobactrum sediminis]PLW81649.1 hypothetical protein CWI75_14365 [Kineobactrum sediminis]
MLARLFSKGKKRQGLEKPALVSFVVVVYDMQLQAENTVRSLLPGYQRGVSGDEYEVIIVENASSRLMREDFLQTLPGNFRYVLRRDPEPSPVGAINAGAEQAKGDCICVMIDGARMLTPGVVRHIIMGHRAAGNAIVAVPGYHLGSELQQEAVSSGYSAEVERELLASIAWPDDGYRLFDIACFSGSSAPGFFLPNSESNCISIPVRVWQALGGYDPQFDLPGGGLVNLDMYKRVCEFPGVQHLVLHGEGSFHQFHGGVTTGGKDPKMRDDYIDNSKRQYRVLRGEEFSSPVTDPIYLGSIHPAVQRFLHDSALRALNAGGRGSVA